MLKRKQFTFYRSFYESALAMPKEDGAVLLMAIVQYALDGVLMEDLTPVQTAVMIATMPTLNTSRRKAKGGMNGSPGKK